MLAKSALPGPVQSPVPAAAPHPEVRVEYDQACIGCGYALRGLPVAGVCPECGMAIARSFRGDRLSAADPDYVRELFRGATLLLGCAVVIVGLWIGSILLALLIEADRIGALALKILLVSGLSVIAVTGAVGAFRLTAADPENLNGTPWHTGRMLARPGVIAAGGGTVSVVLLELSPARNSVAAGLAIAIAVLGLLAALVGLAMVIHTLARRSGERRLARRLRVVAAVFAIAAALLAADRLAGQRTARGIGGLLLLGGAVIGFGLIEDLRSVLKRDFAAARLRRAASPAAAQPPPEGAAGSRQPRPGATGTLS